MIGFYNYTVWLTYVSLAVSLCGIMSAMNGKVTQAVFCLALSGLCDMFDGKIARTKKDRTDDEKAFGIQIDSLCDVICFGVLPAVICYRLGANGTLGILAVVLYCICGVIRLAYFNVLEGRRQQEEEGMMKTYHGLPITSVSVILPVLYMFREWIPEEAFVVCLHIALVAVGLLFVTDFRLSKPKNRVLAVLVAVVATALAVTFFNGSSSFAREMSDKFSAAGHWISSLVIVSEEDPVVNANE